MNAYKTRDVWEELDAQQQGRSTVETGFNITICPKRKLLYKRINAVGNQSLLLWVILGDEYYFNFIAESTL